MESGDLEGGGTLHNVGGSGRSRRSVAVVKVSRGLHHLGHGLRAHGLRLEAGPANAQVDWQLDLAHALTNGILQEERGINF